MLLADLVPLLGQLSDPKSSEATGWIFVALGGLALTCNQVLGAMANFRTLKSPEPGNKQESERIKTLEADMRELELRMERRIGEALGSINSRMGALETTISHLVADFSRALGVLEGKADAANKQK